MMRAAIGLIPLGSLRGGAPRLPESQCFRQLRRAALAIPKLKPTVGTSSTQNSKARSFLRVHLLGYTCDESKDGEQKRTEHGGKSLYCANSHADMISHSSCLPQSRIFGNFCETYFAFQVTTAPLKR
jgi:hypothetical protein